MNFSQSSVFNIVASIGLLFVNLFISMIEARVLGPEEIGRFQVYITTQTYVSTLCALGIGQSCIYFINRLKVDERKVLATSINASLILALLAGVVLCSIILLNRAYFGKEALVYVCMFSVGTSATLLNNIFTPVLLTRMEVVKSQTVKYSTRILTLVVLVSILLLGRQLSVGVLICLTGFTSVLASLLLYYYFHKRFSFRDGIDFPLLGKITLWGVKLSGNNIASITLSSLPVYFLTWFSVQNGHLNVGFYSRANSLLVIGTIIASSIGPLLYSKWSGTTDDELKGQVRRMSMLYILNNSIIATGLIITAYILINIIYGENFIDAVPVLRILAITLVANGLKEVCYGILSSRGYPLLILKNLVWGILITAVGDYFIIPIYGVNGCTAVTAVASIMTAFLLMFDASKVSTVRMADFFVTPTKDDLITIVKQLLYRK